MIRTLLLSLSLLSALAGMGQTFTVPISEPKHLNLDSAIRASRLITDGTKGRALAMAAAPVDALETGAQEYNLKTRCALHAIDGKRTLTDLGMTAATAQAAFPDAWRALTEEKANNVPRYTAAQVNTTLVGLSKYDACWMDALWKNAPYIPLVGSRGLLLSTNNITTPNGAYWLTVQSDLAYGVYRGTSNFNSSDQTGLGGTELHLWHEKWQGDKVNMVMMTAFHGGSDNFYAYSEGQQVHNLRFNGHADTTKRAGRTITCLRAWDTGSGSNYSNLFIHHGDEGLDVVRGTPFTGSGTISLFSNTVCGLCITGGSGGSQGFETLELDDNGRGIYSRAGWGRPAGCELEIDLTKMEELVTPSRFYAPNTLMFDGWTRAQFQAISVAAAWGYLADLFDLRCDINTSHVQVHDLRTFGNRVYQNVIYDRLNNEQLPFDNGYTSRILNVDWYSDAGGTVFVRPNTAATMVPTLRGPGRLGYLKSDPATGQPMGSFDLAATKPAWTDEGGLGGGTGPAPGPCTGWTTGAWGACVGGTQTRTVTATPTGCVGTPANKPASSQTCTVVPPGTPQTINNATSATKVSCTLPLVKSITYTGLKFNTLAANAFGGYLNDNVYCGYNGLYRDQNVLVKAFQQGVSANATVTFAQPVALKWAVGHLDSQTGANWTATKVVLTP